ncbi:MAG: glycosyltransferase [Pseudochelatococcus sp.]|jgi:glycosyltransferase involved in cell wall biosynthesis|uniref:glycosyltransferase n=1 Tax=Pseudochelatococcus sp. TaxID=2020869 RepID=UPI003D902AE1
MTRILIDMQGCQTESRLRGIGRYTGALAHAMAVVAREQACGDDIHLLLNSAFPDSIPEIRRLFRGVLPPDNIHVVTLMTRADDRNPANRWRNHASIMLREAWIEGFRPDVVFCPSFFEGYIDDSVTSVGRLSAVPVVATLHDLIPLIYRENYIDRNPDFCAHYLSKIEELRRCAGLLAISDASASEAQALLEFAPERIVNTSEAAEPKFAPLELTQAERQAFRDRLGLTKPFIFYTGGSDARKNLGRLIAAFGRLPAPLRQRHQLVFAGNMPPGEVEQLQHSVRDAHLDPDDLLLIGYVSDDDLVRLYNLAEVFVFPSRHEGFGLPALEALQCGTPVIASNTSSLPEVVGNPDALFDPLSVDAIARKLEAVLTDDAFRAALVAQGREQAARFSWRNSATLALAALRGMAAVAAHDADWPAALRRLDACQSRLIEALVAPGEAERSPLLSVGPDGADLIEAASAIMRNRVAVESLLRAALPAHEGPLTWRLEGPFDSSYSLALVNRELARGLAMQGAAVSLLSSEGGGDFAPDAAFLARNEDLKAFHEAAQAQSPAAADVVSRNMYPPRVADMTGRFNMLHNYAWEETGFPGEYARDFNDSLQLLTVTSVHVKKIMIDAGVSVPISVCGNGIDHWSRVVAEPGVTLPAAGFVFLHVSSCFPRKGADVLLESYGRAFTARDDVLLVIKTFPNPHNTIEADLAARRAADPDYPAVLILMDDMTDGALKALYEQADVLVAPSRAEGFGLPLAEAILCNLPVIATGWSGQMDFCTPGNASLIDFTFAPASTHLDVWNSVWAEPDAGHLARLMQEARARGRGHRLPAAESEALRERYGWANVAARNIAAVRRVAGRPMVREPSVGWISTFNKRCGIATYSAHLIDVLAMPVTVLAAHAEERIATDGDNIVRCWHEGKPDELQDLLRQIERLQLDVIVIQFNYAFYDFEYFGRFVNTLIDQGRKIVVTLHATIDPPHEPERKLEKIVPALARCQRILVHSVHDMNRLKACGLVNNVTLFPHGVLAPTALPSARPRRPQDPVHVAAYGFFLPHKGLPELIRAIGLLRQRNRDFRLILVNAEYPAEVSRALIAECRTLIEELGLSPWTELHTAFLEDSESLALLSRADVITYAYQETAESASGAVRYGMAAGRPVAVTPLPIFDDLEDAVHRLGGTSPEDIARGLEEMVNGLDADDPASVRRQARADTWREAHTYPLLGQRLRGMLTGLFRENVTDAPPDP